MIMEYSSSNDDLNNFFINTIPLKQKSIEIWCKLQPFYNIKDFFALRDLASKFLVHFRINKLKISCFEFCSYVKAARSVECLLFAKCIIQSDSECNFGTMKDCKIKTFDLSWTGDKICSNWMQNNEKCYNILSGINKCENLRKSISVIELNFSTTGETKDKIIQGIYIRYPNIIHMVELQFKFKENDNKYHEA